MIGLLTETFRHLTHNDHGEWGWLGLVPVAATGTILQLRSFFRRYNNFRSKK